MRKELGGSELDLSEWTEWMGGWRGLRFDFRGREVEESLAVQDGCVVDQDGGGAELRQAPRLSISICEASREMMLGVWLAIWDATYILYDPRPRPIHLLLVPHITSIELHTLHPRPLIHRFHIHHRHTRAPHPVDLRDAQSQPARAARDHNHFVCQIDIARRPIRDALIDDREEVEEGQERGVGGGVDEGRVGVGGCLGAQAERDHPGDEGVEDGFGEDVEEEVEGEVLVPWFLGGGVWRGHGWCLRRGGVGMEICA